VGTVKLARLRRHLGACLLGGFLIPTAACAHFLAYTPLVRGTRGEDPDAVYDAAVHVLARKGWGILVADPGSHEIRTQWFPFRDIGLTLGPEGDYAAQWRVRIAQDRIEVFTGCSWISDWDRTTRPEPCPEGARPEGLRERELELAADILDEARTPRTVGGIGTGAASPAVGCSRDIECKNERICRDGRCVDP
jgi:hypothetical protein